MQKERTTIHGCYPPNLHIPEKYRPRLPDGATDSFSYRISDESRFVTDERYPDVVLEFLLFTEDKHTIFRIHYRDKPIGRLTFSMLEERYSVRDSADNAYADIAALVEAHTENSTVLSTEEVHN